MFVNGNDIKMDDTHKMFSMWMAGMMFALSAAFCTLDGRKMQTKAIVTGNMLMLFLCLRVHQTVGTFLPVKFTPFSYPVPKMRLHFSRSPLFIQIMPYNSLGIGVLAFYSVLLVLSYMSAEGTFGPKCLKTKKAAQKKNW